MNQLQQDPPVQPDPQDAQHGQGHTDPHTQTHVHEIMIYYEDTDFTGVVYHANYLKFFERAREHLLGPQQLVHLYEDKGLGFVVIHAELDYREGAKHGNILQIKTNVKLLSKYRIQFDQRVFLKHKPETSKPIVSGQVVMVCVTKENKLAPIPDFIINEMRNRQLISS